MIDYDNFDPWAWVDEWNQNPGFYSHTVQAHVTASNNRDTVSNACVKEVHLELLGAYAKIKSYRNHKMGGHKWRPFHALCNEHQLLLQFLAARLSEQRRKQRKENLRKEHKLKTDIETSFYYIFLHIAKAELDEETFRIIRDLASAEQQRRINNSGQADGSSLV